MTVPAIPHRSRFHSPEDLSFTQSACFHYRFPPLYAIIHALQHSIDASIHVLLFNVDMFDTYGKHTCVYYILVLKEYWKSSVFEKMSVKNSHKIDFLKVAVYFVRNSSVRTAIF